MTDDKRADLEHSRARLQPPPCGCGGCRNETPPAHARDAPAGTGPGRPPFSGEDGTLCVQRCWSGTIIELLGEHDLTTTMAVEDCLRDALTRGPVVVDLSAAALVDGSILGVLSHVADRAAAHTFVVCAPPGTSPRRLIDLAASLQLIDVAASSKRFGIAMYDRRVDALRAAAMAPG